MSIYNDKKKKKNAEDPIGQSLNTLTIPLSFFSHIFERQKTTSFSHLVTSVKLEMFP